MAPFIRYNIYLSPDQLAALHRIYDEEGTCVLASPCSARVRSASISDVCACTGTPSATSSDLLGTQDVWRSPEVPSELGDVVHIRPLGMRGELPHLHVFEHAASKGGHGTLL